MINKTIRTILLPMALIAAGSPVCARTASSDSISVITYIKEPGKGGLRLAWSENNSDWHTLGDNDGIELVKSDFGPWGSYKKIYDPEVFRTQEGWRALWFVSDKRQTVACADSPDLITWYPQKYADVNDASKFRNSSMKPGEPAEVQVNGNRLKGYKTMISKAHFEKLLAHAHLTNASSIANSERLTDDAKHPSLSMPVTVTAKRSDNKTKRVSPRLFGIFFEDINYAADGGLYAELIQNRDFEYSPSDCGVKDWGPGYGWRMETTAGPEDIEFATENPVHPNNSNYMRIAASGTNRIIYNSGFDGISLRKGENYIFSMFSRSSDSKPCRLNIDLVKGKKVLASSSLTVMNSDWSKLETILKAGASVSDATLRISVSKNSSCDIDMVSLFPEKTYKGRKNGLRLDLASALDSLKPKFVRFPGGCVAHGDGIDNIYDWKGSIGPLESRKPLRNLWGYHQTRGLGYHEYFLFCEDLGAEPLPVLAAGVPCQNSGRAWKGSHNELTSFGQQDGIPDEMMPEYIQDVLDLIEYANGPSTSEWGSKRASAGHPEPFNLKYIGIGNEDMITEVFEQRFKEIFEAVKKSHPEITVVGTVGPFFEGSDYDAGWKIARELNVPIVDEHYYVSPGWLMNNRDYYDSYQRGRTKVYLGEYASHVPGRKNNMETALSTAIYLTDVERNCDVVEMTSYAPLLAKNGHTQWKPDMIYFDNDKVGLTTDYYVQKLFSNNQGDEYIPMSLSFETLNPIASRRIGYSAMRDSESGDL